MGIQRGVKCEWCTNETHAEVMDTVNEEEIMEGLGGFTFSRDYAGAGDDVAGLEE